MKPEDVEPTIIKLKLTGRPKMAEVLEWTAKNMPEVLSELEYRPSTVAFPKLWPYNLGIYSSNAWFVRVPYGWEDLLREEFGL